MQDYTPAQREFATLVKAFNNYVVKSKGLAAKSCLTTTNGDRLYAKTDDHDLPWLPLLYAAANVMDREGDSPAEIRENFERFLEDIVEKQGNEPASRDVHPFELMRAVMVAVIDELMPCLRPMHEFDSIVRAPEVRTRCTTVCGQAEGGACGRRA